VVEDEEKAVTGPRPAVGRASAAVLREVVRFAPAPGARRPATRSGIATLLALSVLTGMERIDLALYATFGSFACVYGGRWPRRRRWRTQAGMGAVMVSSVVVGATTALSPDRALLAVPVTACAAAWAAVTSARRGWTPPGPFFVTFAVATCASVPTTATGVAVATAVAGATAVLAVGLGMIEERFFHAPAPAHPARPDPSRPVGVVRLALRTAGAVLASGLLAQAGGIGHPYWAMVASVALMSGATVHHQLARGVQRAVGTAIGILPALVLLVLEIPLWAVPLVVAAMQVLVELFVARNYALALVFITPLALVVGDLAYPQPTATLLGDRLVETIIGVMVGSLAALLVQDVRRDRRAPA
jgi:hypothetical protein